MSQPPPKGEQSRNTSSAERHDVSPEQQAWHIVTGTGSIEARFKQLRKLADKQPDEQSRDVILMYGELLMEEQDVAGKPIPIPGYTPGMFDKYGRRAED